MPFYLKSKKASYIVNVSVDALLLIVSFILIYFTKRGHINVEQSFLNFLPVYVLSWFLATVSGKKFRIPDEDSLIRHLQPYIFSVLLQMGFLSILLYGFKWFSLSRFIIFGSIGVFFVLEIVLLSGSFVFPIVFKRKDTIKTNFSFYFFLLEFLLITCTFLGIYFYKRGHIQLTDDYKAIFVIIYFSWIFISLFVHKFRIQADANYLKTLWPFVKSTLIQLSLISFFVFAFRILEYSRIILFGSVLLFAAFEYFVVSIIFIYKKPLLSDENKLDFFAAPILAEPKVSEVQPESERLIEGKYKIHEEPVESHGFRKKLKNVYLQNFPKVFDFMEETIDLDAVDLMTSEVIHSSNSYNVEVLPDDSLDLFLNLHTVNDFRRINYYFSEVHKKLKWKGLLAGKFETYQKRQLKLFKKYPYYLAILVYGFDFIWKRVFPKLPFFQKIYFALSKGKDRVISKAEVLGRLYFCGFEIVALQEIDEDIYFIVKKTKIPSDKTRPSYGPLFKMKREGKNNKPIYIYKFRTMHPYSEYLQNFLIQRNGYSKNTDKINDDFRVTAWGHVLRKYWLDEIPQLINFFKGDLGLVGVRPISKAGLQRFNREYLEIRGKFKPGCIPPYVALKMQNISDYEKSEQIYLASKQRHPYITDIRYFLLAVYNILTNKIRSA